jgi:hypothetical protein
MMMAFPPIIANDVYAKPTPSHIGTLAIGWLSDIYFKFYYNDQTECFYVRFETDRQLPSQRNKGARSSLTSEMKTERILVYF